eukprot:Colp12_sorted_trinity150504_noHs@15628
MQYSFVGWVNNDKRSVIVNMVLPDSIAPGVRTTKLEIGVAVMPLAEVQQMTVNTQLDPRRQQSGGPKGSDVSMGSHAAPHAVCCYFLRNTCQKGDSCRFLHEHNSSLPCSMATKPGGTGTCRYHPR